MTKISLCQQFISIVRTVQLPERQSSDEDRIKMTEILLDKLYGLGLINNNQSLEDLRNKLFLFSRIQSGLKSAAHSGHLWTETKLELQISTLA